VTVESPLSLARLARLGALAVSVALVAVACGSGGPLGPAPAATAQGRDVSVTQVNDLLRAQQRYLEAEGKKSTNDPAAVQQQLKTLLGNGQDTFSATSAADAGSSWVTYEVLEADLERAGEKITETDRNGARAALVQQLGSEEALNKIDKELVEFSVNSGAAYQAIGRVAAKNSTDREAQLQRLYEATKATTPLCLRIIFSEDEAASKEAKARVEAGEDFGAVAKEVSADPTTAEADGFAGCATAEQATQAFGSDFSDVAVGDVIGPITQSQGVLLVEVVSTDGPTFEQAKPKLEQQLDSAQGGNQSSVYVAALLAKADVQVDPRSGTWDPTSGRVVPPAVGTTTSIPAAPAPGAAASAGS